jgi:type II secretory pathway component GspD/PulD (secretin)
MPPGDKPVESVQRPKEPETPPNPDELKVRPNEAGMISFSFKGQPWPSVLEWLADISGLSLHWEEAPQGYVDLTTRGQYSVEEVRDLLNSVLLAKGFSVLKNGEILVVVNLQKLDVSLVPRVSPDELDERGNYELVKVFFDLDWLVAERVIEEIRPLLSPYGKISAMKTTNRLDVLESAGNLRRIRELLSEEQSANGEERLIREFRLKHRRASEVLTSLQELLGMETRASGAQQPMSPEQQMAMQQQQMMLAQQQAAMQAQAGAQPAKEAPVFLSVNTRENSILVNAPPDKMEIIDQAVQVIDVPQDRSQSILSNLPRLRVYRLTGINPDTMVRVLNDLGGMDPSTRLEVDAKNGAVIAYAPLVDHLTIQSIVDKLDGSARHFEVIQLRVLQAEYVAGSIQMLMGGKEESNQNNRYGYYFYDPWGYGGSRNDEPKDKFQVEADIENNRLLLRANDVEMAEIRDLLIKLGELTNGERNLDTLRVIPALPGEDADNLLNRIRQMWPSLRANPLEVSPDAGASRPAEDAPGVPGGRPDTEKAVPEAEAEAERKANVRPESLVGLAPIGSDPTDEDELDHRETEAGEAEVESHPFANDAAGVEDGIDGGSAVPSDPPPVSITVGPQGLVITSADPAALDQLEELVATIRPAKPSFKIFTLRHTFAEDIADLLDDVFKEEKKSRSDRASQMMDMMWNGASPQQGSARASLSKRKPLKFVPDKITNTILVQGADANQLAEVGWLIDQWDRVEPPDSNSVRRTQIIPLRYAQAKVVAETVKDVFRDLLSPNDKALIGSNPQPQQQPQQNNERGSGSFFDSMMMSFLAAESDAADVPRFKGMLSIGIDDRSNTLIVSAPQILLDEVSDMVAALDNKAALTRPVVEVMQLSGPGMVKQIHESLQQKNGTTLNGPAGAAAPGQPDGQTPPPQAGTPPQGAPVATPPM